MIPEPTDLGSPQLTIEDNYKYKSQKDLYIISAEWVLSVKFEKDTENFLEINALYNVVLSKSEELSKDFWNIYKKATLPLIVYPYFREFVQNITSRMNIPPLTLPILYR